MASQSAPGEGSSTSTSNGGESSESKEPVNTNPHYCHPPMNGFATTDYRNELTTTHRELMQSMIHCPGGLALNKIIEQHFPAPNMPASGLHVPPRQTKLRPIMLSSMSRAGKGDKVFYHFFIHLNVIEDPITAFSGTSVLFQDDNGDVERGVIYCVKYEEVQAKLGFGSRLTILNPMMRMAVDNKPAIRLDDNKNVIFHPQYKDTTMCRFCSKRSASLKCARCLRAYYCNKECQTSDWKILKHKRVCDYLKLA